MLIGKTRTIKQRALRGTQPVGVLYLPQEEHGLVQLELQNPRFDEVKRAAVDLDQATSTLAISDGSRSFLRK